MCRRATRCPNRKRQVNPVPNPLPDTCFFATEQYEGARSGFIFKKGSRGTGYYVDNGSEPPPLPHAKPKPSPPKPLQLEESVLPPSHNLSASGTASWCKDIVNKEVSGEATQENVYSTRRRSNACKNRKKRRADTKGPPCQFNHATRAGCSDWRDKGYWALDTFNSTRGPALKDT